MSNFKELEKQIWDVIVVGTGVGGATIGHALAKSGKNVLFCEKGKNLLNHAHTVRNQYPLVTYEDYFKNPNKTRQLLSHYGRYYEPLVDNSKKHPAIFVPFLGCGTGGSSSLYGMAMERFHPCDFKPGQSQSEARESNLPDEWPFSYESLLPYYEAAEKLYGVHGTRDPLSDNTLSPLPSRPALTELGRDLFSHFQSKNLHPYQLPLACRFSENCRCCQGFLCMNNCKNDAENSCLQPAIHEFGATLLDDCEVVALEADKKRVQRLLCKSGGTELYLQGNTIILAAGALETPALLLRSNSSIWPQGLSNSSGMVGRNLMRHFTDLYLVQTNCETGDNRQKELAVNNFYSNNGQKLGTIQSFGRLPPAEVIESSLEDDLRYSQLNWLIPGLRLIKPLLRRSLVKMVAQSAVLATIMEDRPYSDNRLVVTKKPGDSIERQLHYRIAHDDEKRILAMRQKMREILAPRRFKLLKQAENNRLLAHVCGTCRAGLTAHDNVLDPDNRAHDLDNLYVIDSSFFPSSGGTNPSLTIAANALRVADIILAS